MWQCFLYDTMTGRLGAPIDLPSFRWSVSVSDCSLATQRDKGTGSADATGLDVPWSAVPGDTPIARAHELASYRRSLVLCWQRADGELVPVVGGAIGPRTDSWSDTSFSLVSPMQMLGSRVLVREGVVGKGEFRADHTKRADGTSYGRDLGGFRPYMRWERTETPDNVSLWCEMGIEVTADKVDADDVWIEATVGDSTKEWQMKGGLHKEGAASRVVCMTDSASKARAATQSSLKASVKVSVPSGEVWKSSSGGHKKGDPKYKSSSATVTATIKTAADYEASYKKLSNTSHASVTVDTLTLTGSLRSIASQAVYLCTMAKPSGQLPIDLPYRGESGKDSRTYSGSDLANLTCDKVLKDIADSPGGPDLQLRPHMAYDGSYSVRYTLIGGTSASPGLPPSGTRRTLAAFPQGGQLHDVKIAHLGPTMRVYACGAGQDEAQLQVVAEDLTLCKQHDPWPIFETVKSWTSDEDAGALSDHADAALDAVSTPLMQLQADVCLGDAVEPGDIWPGDIVNVVIEGHPCFPDGTYPMRLMQMEGSQGAGCTLTFDAMEDPWGRWI
jgi:hypothetical protein